MNNEPRNETIQDQLHAQQEALVQIYTSVEKTRKIMLWSGIINIIVFIIPLVAVVFILPQIMNTFTNSLDMLDTSTLDTVSRENIQEALGVFGDLGL